MVEPGIKLSKNHDFTLVFLMWYRKDNIKFSHQTEVPNKTSGLAPITKGKREC